LQEFGVHGFFGIGIHANFAGVRVRRSFSSA
jgi:hypothetical protein